MPEMHEYDVALSFAGEDRKYAKELAEILRSKGLKVFYDDFEKENLWGVNLYDYLANVYNKKARFCVMFLSKNYAKKLWTNHERQAAQARAFRENKAYILPVRLDPTEIPGILQTVGYLDIKSGGLTLNDIANLVLEKLRNEQSIYNLFPFPLQAKTIDYQPEPALPIQKPLQTSSATSKDIKPNSPSIKEVEEMTKVGLVMVAIGGIWGTICGAFEPYGFWEGAGVGGAVMGIGSLIVGAIGGWIEAKGKGGNIFASIGYGFIYSLGGGLIGGLTGCILGGVIGSFETEILGWIIGGIIEMLVLITIIAIAVLSQSSNK